MQYTRSQIIEFLRDNHTASVPELSQRLNLTITNIRHHVKELESRNLVKEIGRIPGEGRGRPTKVYALASDAIENNLPVLTVSLLNVHFSVEFKDEESTQNRYLAIATDMTGPIEHDPNPIHRLNQGVAWLNQHNYRARWEASASGPRVILEQCPYSEVHDQFPGLCQLDIAILGRLFGVAQGQITMSQQPIPGSQLCILTIG